MSTNTKNYFNTSRGLKIKIQWKHYHVVGGLFCLQHNKVSPEADAFLRQELDQGHNNTTTKVSL